MTFPALAMTYAEGANSDPIARFVSRARPIRMDNGDYPFGSRGGQIKGAPEARPDCSVSERTAQSNSGYATFCPFPAALAAGLDPIDESNLPPSGLPHPVHGSHPLAAM